MATQVIVVGGGPVGLLSAALLHAAGVEVEIYEREAQASPASKATTMHPRTLEVLSTLDFGDGRRISDVLVELGRPTPHAHFAALPDLLDYAELDTPFPFVLMIPQWHTERVLADYLRAKDIPVHRGRAVRQVEQSADGVRVLAGDTSQEAGHLIGADGAHSTVRHALGVDFPGAPPNTLAFGADVTLAQPLPSAQHFWHRDTGSVSVMPLPEGRYRIFGTEAANTGLTEEQVRARQAEPPTLDELRATTIRVHGTDFGLREASWLYRINNTSRHAAQFRVGRVFLAGDAAHVHLPAGGQGLNVGLQDAANLAWKLAAEVHGWAPPALIEGEFSYDHERRRVAELLATNTLAQDALMNTFSHAGEALRTVLSGVIARGGETAREFAGWLSGLDVHYPPVTAAHPLVGTRAPDLALADGSLLRSLRPDRFLLADFDPNGSPLTRPTKHIDVRPAQPRPGAYATLRAALIRPDGYVAYAVEAMDSFDSKAIAAWTEPAARIGAAR